MPLAYVNVFLSQFKVYPMQLIIISVYAGIQRAAPKPATALSWALGKVHQTTNKEHQKMIQNRPKISFGSVLGHFGEGLGSLFGIFCVQNRARRPLGAHLGPMLVKTKILKGPQTRLWGRIWEHFRRIWKSLGRLLGGIWEDFVFFSAGGDFYCSDDLRRRRRGSVGTATKIAPASKNTKSGTKK